MPPPVAPTAATYATKEDTVMSAAPDTKSNPAKPAFRWEDPFDLDSQLTDVKARMAAYLKELGLDG